MNRAHSGPGSRFHRQSISVVRENGSPPFDTAAGFFLVDPALRAKRDFANGDELIFT